MKALQQSTGPETVPPSSPASGPDSSIALAAQIQQEPSSTRELFDLLADGVRRSGQKLGLINLGAIETDIRGDGSLVLKFTNGQIMGLDAFIREAVGRGLFTRGGEVQVPIDRHEISEVPAFAAWSLRVTEQTGVGIAAYPRADVQPLPGAIAI